LKLGGPRTYHGQPTEAQWIGTGREDCGAYDIFRALKLYAGACLVNAAAVAFAAFVLTSA
jgi:cobalamin biosynthesis protein CobD/CbiB